MHRPSFFVGALVCVSTLLFPSEVAAAASTELEFIYAGSLGSYGSSGMNAVYDGRDSVYLLEYTFLQDVLRYSIATKAVSNVGKFPYLCCGGSIPMTTRNGDIWYFGGTLTIPYGGPSSLVSSIYTFSTTDGKASLVGNLTQPLGDTSVVLDSSKQIAYIFGGYGETQDSAVVSSFDGSSLVEVAKFPFGMSGTAAVWVPSQGVAYIFGGDGDVNAPGRSVFKYNPALGTVSQLSAKLPHYVSKSCAVLAAGDQVLLTSLDKGLIQFDTVTHEMKVLPIKKYFGGEGTQPVFPGAACAYVPKLTRLYVFGGTHSYGNSVYYTEVGSLVPLTPPVTTTSTQTPTSSSTTTTTTAPPPSEECSYGTSRLIPDPSCCESYLSCNNGAATKLVCPSGLQFNPSSSQCENSSVVKCRITYDA